MQQQTPVKAVVNHGRDEGRRGFRVGVQDPGVVGPAGQLGEKGLALGAAATAEVGGLAGRVRPGAGEVHEEAQLVVDVEFGVLGFAESHPVALAFLVVFCYCW
jgi:hypothetical protein